MGLRLVGVIWGALEGSSQMALVVKNLPANTGGLRDGGLTPWSSIFDLRSQGRSPGGGSGNPLPYSYLENSMDRGSWWATAIESERVRLDRSDLGCKAVFPNFSSSRFPGDLQTFYQRTRLSVPRSLLQSEAALEGGPAHAYQATISQHHVGRLCEPQGV